MDNPREEVLLLSRKTSSSRSWVMDGMTVAAFFGFTVFGSWNLSNIIDLNEYKPLILTMGIIFGVVISYYNLNLLIWIRSQLNAPQARAIQNEDWNNAQPFFSPTSTDFSTRARPAHFPAPPRTTPFLTGAPPKVKGTEIGTDLFPFEKFAYLFAEKPSIAIEPAHGDIRSSFFNSGLDRIYLDTATKTPTLTGAKETPQINRFPSKQSNTSAPLYYPWNKSRLSKPRPGWETLELPKYRDGLTGSNS